jgi:hypothetical protein
MAAFRPVFLDIVQDEVGAVADMHGDICRRLGELGAFAGRRRHRLR